MEVFSTSSDADCLEVFIRRMFMRVNTSIPAIITSFNKDLQIVKVKPCIKAIKTIDDNKEYVELPELIEVPIITPYSFSSGFSLTFPIKPGDECLLLFSQRSIDYWLNSGGIQCPVEDISPRNHSLSDAIAIAGLSSKPNSIKDYQNDCIELRNKDRGVRVTLNDEEVEINVIGKSVIKLNNKGEITIESTVKTDINTLDLNINALGLISMNAPLMNIDVPNTTWIGNIEHTGVINTIGDHIANGISLSTHEHPGDGDGTAPTTGPPIQ
jgi:phage baseplate assembly protein gpV